MEEEKKIARWHIFFEGDVQAVGFRYTSMIYAKQLGLTGWVQNLYDERVEMEVQGPVSKIRQLLLHLKSHPPIYITDYQIQEIALKPNESNFRITGY